MIGHIQGEVLFSDGSEAIVLTNSGIGYQTFYHKILPENSLVSLYISHVIKEAAEELYGFETLKEKKLFEMLIQVKGVGPKSAFALLSFLGPKQIIEAIIFDNKKSLTKAPGVGQKAAAQIILDLNKKIHKIKMYSDNYKIEVDDKIENRLPVENAEDGADVGSSLSSIMDEALLACKELGFKEDKILPLAQKILGQHNIAKPEQLVHLVLKEV